MYKMYSIVFHVQSYIANPALYMYLTIASEICGALRMYPTFYVCKVCIDMIREMQKIFILTGTMYVPQKEECMHYTPCTDEPDAPIAPAPWEPPLYTVGRIEVSSEQYSEMVDAHIACAKRYVQKHGMTTIHLPVHEEYTPEARKKTTYIGIVTTVDGEEKPFYAKL